MKVTEPRLPENNVRAMYRPTRGNLPKSALPENASAEEQKTDVTGRAFDWAWGGWLGSMLAGASGLFPLQVGAAAGGAFIGSYALAEGSAFVYNDTKKAMADTRVKNLILAFEPKRKRIKGVVPDLRNAKLEYNADDLNALFEKGLVDITNNRVIWDRSRQGDDVRKAEKRFRRMTSRVPFVASSSKFKFEYVDARAYRRDKVADMASYLKNRVASHEQDVDALEKEHKAFVEAMQQETDRLSQYADKNRLDKYR